MEEEGRRASDRQDGVKELRKARRGQKKGKRQEDNYHLPVLPDARVTTVVLVNPESSIHVHWPKPIKFRRGNKEIKERFCWQV